MQPQVLSGQICAAASSTKHRSFSYSHRGLGLPGLAPARPPELFVGNIGN